MTDLVMTCGNEKRRRLVRERKWFGLDYLEVGPDQRTLTAYFLGKAPDALVKENVRIEGGRRIRDIRVLHAEITREEDEDLDDSVVITVDKPGDFSTYTLRLVGLDNKGQPTTAPPPHFDPRYSSLAFSFKADCPNDLDCRVLDICPPEKKPTPDINYLAKDYGGFRQLILDRLAVVMPDWRERHAADLEIALVEVLAYVGDHLSYYQDAVATEAYLDTARQRVSVRRHVRLVDYRIHEGCNARAWICLQTNSNFSVDPEKTSFITGKGLGLLAGQTVLTELDLRNVSAALYERFQPLVESPGKPIPFYAAHSALSLYTWGDTECCLPRGATRATLRGHLVDSSKPGGAPTAGPEVHLQPGAFLLFEEVKGPKTGLESDADPAHRHVVRLTRVNGGEDALCGQQVIEIEWAVADALPFPLCLSALVPDMDCQLVEDISVACGNVILVDQGWQVREQWQEKVPTVKVAGQCDSEGRPSESWRFAGRFRPTLKQGPLTFSQPLQASGTASTFLTQDPRKALPRITLEQLVPGGAPILWRARPDLLESGPDDRHFVVEMDNYGIARLRFGDGDLGRQPDADTTFQAAYHVGIAPAGNVGAEAISHLVLKEGTLSGVNLIIRNPLPAQGGTPPESLTEIRALAPHAYRKELHRAVTADDYALLAAKHTQVQRAAAALRWTGAWYEADVCVDPLGQSDLDPDLRKDIQKHLYCYRRMGHDLLVLPAATVALEIALKVCVMPHYQRGHVEAALLDLFSNRVLPGGRLGFFHPDNWTFGQGVAVSKIIAAAQAVAGVETVVVTKLQRLFEKPNQELSRGFLAIGPREVVRLDNDPSFPENGTLVVALGGGR